MTPQSGTCSRGGGGSEWAGPHLGSWLTCRVDLGGGGGPLSLAERKPPSQAPIKAGDEGHPRDRIHRAAQLALIRAGAVPPEVAFQGKGHTKPSNQAGPGMRPLRLSRNTCG